MCRHCPEIVISLTAPNLEAEMGLKDMTAGRYEFHWFDCATGKRVTQTEVNVAACDQAWSKPADIGNELAVYIKRIEQ